MNRADYFNVDSDAGVFGQTDILLFRTGTMTLNILQQREKKTKLNVRNC